MSERFVIVPTRKWRDAWYRSLTPDTRATWDFLTQSPDARYTGIFEALMGDMAHDAMVEQGAYQGATEGLIAAGKLLHENNCWLVVSWFGVQHRGVALKADDKLSTAIRQELESFMAKCPNLVLYWIERYAPWMEMTLPKPLASPLCSPLPSPSTNPSISISTNISNKPQPSETPQFTAEPSPPPDTTPSELAILTELKSIASHPFDWKQDLQYIRTLTLDFPTLDLLAVVKSLHAWLDDNPKKKSGRLRLRNSCELALKWGKNLKPNPDAYDPDEYEHAELAD